MEWRPRRQDPHLLLFLRHTLPWNISASYWTRSILERLGGFSESLPRLQDVDLHARALLVGTPYQVIKNAKADFYYRIAKNRDTFGTAELCKRYMIACEVFSTSMIRLIEERADLSTALRKRYLRALRGTTLAILFRLAQEYARGGLEESQWRDLRERLSSSQYIVRIFGRRLSALYLYNIMLRLGMARMRGFMRISQFFIS